MSMLQVQAVHVPDGYKYIGYISKMITGKLLTSWSL